ncbi:MAG TPA: hypothetical protein VMU34_04095 [Mycobacterium sp.]|nr:hypothetical protein [Mycobacterium sp.]
MLSKTLTGLAGAVAAALMAVPAVAGADPDAPPPPPPPNVNAYPPVSPADYSAMSGAWYAFGTGDGLTCVIQKGSGGYGCSGPIPGAPNGANVVSGGATGAPDFANADASVFAVAGPVKPLPPNTRLSYRQISCGTDGAGTTSCLNSFDQSGFVITPGGSYIVGQTPPLLDRPRT